MQYEPPAIVSTEPTELPNLGCCRYRTCRPGSTQISIVAGRSYWVFHQHRDANGGTLWIETTTSRLDRGAL